MDEKQVEKKPKRRYIKKNKPKQPQQTQPNQEEINLVKFDFKK
jgi:hypothetical protein